MTSVYVDNAITGEIIRIIDQAQTKVALISPYVDKVMHVEQAIGRAMSRNVKVSVFIRQDGTKLGGGGKADQAVEWFRRNNVEVVGVPNLHAKFYINETEAVVSSMNLLTSSWANSLELGVTVSGAAHQQLTDYLNKTIFPWAKSEPIASVNARPNAHKPKSSSPRPPRTVTVPPKQNKGFFGSVFEAVKGAIAFDEGFCIRCGESLSDAEVASGKTMCRKDYVAWAKFKNPNFVEKYCAVCGKKSKTSFAKPECKTCFAESR